MNSAALTLPLHSFPEPSHWDDVRRIYRRICVLRATGKIDDAAELEHGEFAHAVSVARIAAVAGEDEAAILSAEAERVANAGILAELLAPLLAEHLRTDPRLTASRAPISATVPIEKPKPVPAVRPSAPVIPSITDLIDGMLAQER